LKRMKPGEVQFLTYGRDLDVEVKRKVEREDSVPEAITLSRSDVVELHVVRKRELSLTLENRTGLGRSVYVRLDVGANATIAGADAVDFDGESQTGIAVFELQPRSQRTATLRLAEGKAQRTSLGSLDSKQLDQLAAVDKLTAAQRQALAAARTIVKRSQDELAELTKIERQRKERDKDIERLRKHLGALPAASAAGGREHPFVARLEKAEDEVERLQARTRDLTQSREALAEQLRATLAPFAR
jgi:hypothetical protein